MGRINILRHEISEKIAAGEVVERPASVVKELIENSIDAGSDNIQIFLSKAGKELIRVIDNGLGIHPEDVELAFSRHATSKVNSIKDLDKINTLGFRGEALASIAAVSKIEMNTRRHDSKEGTRVFLEEGKVQQRGSAGCPPGTDIAVKDLFYNTPARLKFLSKESTEIALIHDIINKFALANPNIRFRALNGNKKLLQTSGRNDMLEVIANIYGYQTAKKLLPIKYSQDGITITGYIAKPELTRSNRSYQTFFVNDRYVKSTFLSERLEKGYHTLLPKHRYPFSILKLQVPDEILDVNVHPAKIHVRFINEKQIGNMLTKAVTEKLKQEQLIFQAPKVNNTKKNQTKPEGSQLRFRGVNKNNAPSFEKTSSKFKSQLNNNVYDNISSKTSNNYLKEKQEYDIPRINNKVDHTKNHIENQTENHIETHQKTQEIGDQEKTSDSVHYGSNPSSKPIGDSSGKLSDDSSGESYSDHIDTIDLADNNENFLHDLLEYRVVGQIFTTYWILESSDEIYLIDQHAAHERINYQLLMDRYRSSQLKSQQVIPYTLELDSAGITALEDNLDKLRQCGLEFEFFGQNTLLVRGVPFAIKDIFDQDAIYDLIDQLIKHPDNDLDITSLEEMLITIACKKSIKANEKIGAKELKSLLKSLVETPTPFTCPHGRPTIINLTRTDVEKLFYRV
ncbi:DNA mismatch repair endonuclease MutL [Natranaerobius thermophilus]|uniref:DNA mismatch repair protein MutL n=1 Tax=Natranaerobius thermophilus (strain ATCC BAA-1301 / DSM 18059 / JW/NM-WN-LF) TaxID=457570 RepID=B2A3X8_NATTJ|nr:DNA mismatch repair endonuclease MutL [Natranaerobius thermophilus]ACB85080.1 DNA mismatch repair protein MutL [Natranaerobius thermophilus JW/NM-WN-LF]